MGDYPNGDTPPQTIAALARADLAPVLDHGERLRGRVLTDDVLDLTAARIKDALEPRRPCAECKQRPRVPAWVVRLIRDMAEGVGVRLEVDARIMALVGVPLPEAQAAVRAVQRVEALDEDRMYRLAMERVEAYHRVRGERVLVVRDAEAEAE